MFFSAPKVKALAVILQNRFGAKFYAKYYTKYSQVDFSKTEYDIKKDDGQNKLQKALSQKVKKMNVVSTMTPEKSSYLLYPAEIFSFGGYTVLFKVINQLFIFLLCDEEENFVLMENIIECLGKSLNLISAEPYHQKTIEDNLDSIILSVDQIIDEGIILCLDQNVVFDRIKMKDSSDKSSQAAKKDTNQKSATATSAGKTFNALFGFAKNTIQKTLNLG